MRGHSEGHAHVHAARVALDWGIDELLHLGEGYDLVELAGDLRLLHAQNGAVQENIVAARQLGMESGSDFEQRAYAAPDIYTALGRLGDAGQNLQQRALARTVPADYPHPFSPLDLV